MVTRRNRQMRRGSGRWFTQPIRRYTGFNRFGPSTSKLARDIHMLFVSDLTHEEIVFYLRDLLERNRNVNKKNFITELKNLGIQTHSPEMYEINAELEYTLPSKKRELTYNQ